MGISVGGSVGGGIVFVGSCVSVGDGGISVGVLVGRSVLVGTGVSVRVGGTAVLVGGTGVFVGSGLGRRVLVGSLTVGKRKAVGVRGVTVIEGLDVIVGGRVEVDVGISSANACIVSAPTVFKLETAASTISPGAKSTPVVDSFRSCIAIPETEHSKPIPSAAATKTARSPR